MVMCKIQLNLCAKIASSKKIWYFDKGPTSVSQINGTIIKNSRDKKLQSLCVYLTKTRAQNYLLSWLKVFKWWSWQVRERQQNKTDGLICFELKSLLIRHWNIVTRVRDRWTGHCKIGFNSNSIVTVDFSRSQQSKMVLKFSNALLWSPFRLCPYLSIPWIFIFSFTF